MSSTKRNALRNIAEAELDRRLGDLDSQRKQELATSLVRQWLTNDGHAGLATPSGHYWFRMIRTDSGFEVGCQADPPDFMDILRHWKVAEKQIPGLLHQLSLCQSTLCQTQAGQTVCLRMIAKERMLRIEPTANEDE